MEFAMSLGLRKWVLILLLQAAVLLPAIALAGPKYPSPSTLWTARQYTDFYFVHSYGFKPVDPANIYVDSQYGGTFSSIVGHNNVVGFQFHPEKSQVHGLKLLENFCDWNGRC